MLGAVPLGLSFVLTYVPPPAADGAIAIGWIMSMHMVFRSAYALVNVPYLAMSARITLDSSERAVVAGLRMMFGTLAAVIVAVLTVPLGRTLSGGAGASGYAAAAAAFAGVATALLVAVGWAYREVPIPAEASHQVGWRDLPVVLRNRAYLSLSVAMIAMIVAVTVLDKSVLYYFKYALDDQGAGQQTLGWMSAVSGLAVPLWLLVSRRVGVRGVWFLASGTCSACLIVFIAGALAAPRPIQLVLVVIQSAIVGLHFAFWALLPDTIEYGQHIHGRRAEALVYGLAGLLQRLAIGLGTLVLGLGLGLKSGGLHHASVDTAGYRLVLAVIPLGFFALAALAMLANPLRRGFHAKIVAGL
jgi:GPH family glycoside/pentoside/hexuronide:cation symporter